MKRRLHLNFVCIDSDNARRDLSLIGQFARTLRALVEAGAKGITALDVSNTWALRLGHYVWVLRHRHGLSISTTYEPHDGAAGPGKHGRYTLNTKVLLANTSDVEAT